MTNESTNMKANRNTGMNETCALSTVELDAVSGGKMMFDFTVAGMHITGGYSRDGGYGVIVEYGTNAIAQGGKV